MDSAKKERLRKRGWRVGTADEFLELTPEESTYLDMKIGLGNSLRTRRKREQLSQVELAERIRSSQSRVAKMERGDPSVSLDLLVRSLLALGASGKEVGRIISRS